MATLCCLLGSVHIASHVSVQNPRRGGRLVKSRYKFRVLLFPLLGTLAACGGGGDGDGGGSSSSSGGGTGNTTTWQPGVYLPSSNFDAMCVAPRAGTADRAGTATDQNNWLRSWTNELYLWYSEVTDRDPSLSNTVDYFRAAEDQRHHPIRAGQGQIPLHLRHRGVAVAVAGRRGSGLRR